MLQLFANFGSTVSALKYRAVSGIHKLLKSIAIPLFCLFTEGALLPSVQASDAEIEKGTRLLNEAADLHEHLDDEGALRKIDEAIALLPPFPTLFQVRGIFLEDLNRYQEALASFNVAVELGELEPDQLYCFLADRANLRVILDDRRGAVEDAKRAKSLAPANADPGKMKIIAQVLTSPAPAILPAKETDDARYFALVPGNEWTMDAAGTSKTGDAKGLGHYKMEGREQRGGKTYTVRHDNLSVGPVHLDEMNYYRTDADGLHTIFGATEALGEQLEVPFPIRPGHHWTVWNHFGLLDYTVVGFETVTVPAGAYKNCCHLRIQGAMGVSDVWLAPGVGAVKSTIVSDGGSTLFQSLTAFKPAHP